MQECVCFFATYATIYDTIIPLLQRIALPGPHHFRRRTGAAVAGGHAEQHELGFLGPQPLGWVEVGRAAAGQQQGIDRHGTEVF